MRSGYSKDTKPAGLLSTTAATTHLCCNWVFLFLVASRTLHSPLAHDHNVRFRIEAYVMARNAKNKREGQHPRPTTAAYQRVLHALP
jgi:hypothetical protein